MELSSFAYFILWTDFLIVLFLLSSIFQCFNITVQSFSDHRSKEIQFLVNAMQTHLELNFSYLKSSYTSISKHTYNTVFYQVMERADLVVGLRIERIF